MSVYFPRDVSGLPWIHAVLENVGFCVLFKTVSVKLALVEEMPQNLFENKIFLLFQFNLKTVY